MEDAKMKFYYSTICSPPTIEAHVCLADDGTEVEFVITLFEINTLLRRHGYITPMICLSGIEGKSRRKGERRTSTSEVEIESNPRPSRSQEHH